MIAVDTNVLVHAHRKDSPWNARAFAALKQLAEGRIAWAVPWPCVYEFLAIVTHPRIYKPPTPVARALDQVDAWLQSPSVVLLAEAEDYWPRLKALVAEGRIEGAQVHDARVAALCLLHGVDELWSADRDFSRFGALRVRNPLVGMP